MTEAIVFGTDGWRATLSEFTADRVRRVGQAVASYLVDHGLTGAPVAIGYDARESSPGFAHDLAEVLQGNGIDVMRSTRDIPTPLVAWTIADRRLAGGLMVTASHNPPEYNGVKFITAAGAPSLPAVTDALEERLAPPRAMGASEDATETPLDAIGGYSQHIRDLVGADLDGLSIVYDAMHGSGRGVTDRVLTEAGAAVNAFRCTRDPTFGGVGPNPTPENLELLEQTVTRTGADLGLANDGDADRIAVVTPKRGYLSANLLFAVLYDYLLETQTGPAIRTVSTTHLIDRIADAHGEAVIETAVGFKWVAAAMREHDALVGGEESGGFSIRGHVREKDGVLLALLVAKMTATESIDERVDRIIEEYGDIYQDSQSIACPEPRKGPVMDDLDSTIPKELAGTGVEDISTVDGYKVSLEDGAWMLVRPSGTEPKLRVYAEATDPERAETIVAAGVELLEPLV